METTHNTTGPSLILVLWHKLISFVENHTFVQLLSFIGLAFLAGYLSSAWINLDWTIRLTRSVVLWNGYAIPKITGVTVLVFNARAIWSGFLGFVYSAIELFSGESVTDTLDGVPTSEILDHLFTEKSFKRDDIEAKFDLPRYKVTELTRNLKRVGVLTHGENNSSVLNPEYSRQDVASILRRVPSSDKLQPLFRRKSETCYTSDPTALEIQDRVNTLLSPAPAFRKREIPVLA